MTVSASLEKHFCDQLSPLGGVSSRRMFGAFCLFRDGAAFAIVDDGTLFLKADDAMKAEMKAGGGRPFTYPHKDRGPVEMSYCSPPDTAFDDETELLQWARRSIALANARRTTRTTKKTATKKAATKKTATKKAATKKAATKKKAPSKKAPSKKAPSKKASTKKKTATKKKQGRS